MQERLTFGVLCIPFSTLTQTPVTCWDAAASASSASERTVKRSSQCLAAKFTASPLSQESLYIARKMMLVQQALNCGRSPHDTGPNAFLPVELRSGVHDRTPSPLKRGLWQRQYKTDIILGLPGFVYFCSALPARSALRFGSC
jgi:hypothetical protein